MKNLRALALFLTACAASPPKGPATEADAKAAYDAKQWSKCATLYASLADHGTGAARQSALYDGACCAARDGKPDRAFELLDRAAIGGLRTVQHTRTDEDLVSLHGDARWPRLLAKVEGNQKTWEASLGDPALRRELLAMFAADQKARNEVDAESPSLVDAVVAVDAKNTARLKEIVAAKGWPGKKLVGGDGAMAAWTIVQHADADRSFQQQCLPLLESAVTAGDAEPADYAYLFDRVSVNHGRPQRYGTQVDEAGEPRPLEDPANVDARRKTVGLEPLETYKARLRAK